MPKRTPKTKPKQEPLSKGTQLAAEIRKEANTMTDAERENALHEGLALVYGKGKNLPNHANRG